MTTSNAKKIGAALVVASALATSGCFASGETGGEGDNRMTVAHMQPPRSGLSPLSDDAFKLSRWATAETLVQLDADGNALPMLATEWSSEDNKTWRFAIREDVTFHDGAELNAETVVSALNAALKATPQPRILNGTDLTFTAEGNEVVVESAEVDPLIPQRMSSPQLAILSPEAYSGDAVDPVGRGTGPFELVSVDGTTSATLNAYADYWGEAPKVDGIDASFVPDGTARTAALSTGEADVVEAIPVGNLATVDEALIHEVPMPRTNTLYLNTESGPFADPAIRAAAEAAIQRAEIVDNVYEGHADEAAGLLGPALPWAASLRDEAAYAQEIEQRATPAEVNGVEISLGTFTDRAELPEVAVRLEQQLEAAGFVVTQDVREYQYIEQDALDGAFDAFILSRATVLDSGDPVAYLSSDFSCEGTFNISQFCDPVVDTLISKASATEPGPERHKAVLAAEAAILSRTAAIPLLHERVLQGEQAHVVDAERDPRERILITEKTALTND